MAVGGDVVWFGDVTDGSDMRSSIRCKAMVLGVVLMLTPACSDSRPIALEFVPPADDESWRDCGGQPGVDRVIVTPVVPVAGVSFQLGADATDSDIETILDCLEAADVRRSDVVLRTE
jgi:hypothetical protein